MGEQQHYCVRLPISQFAPLRDYSQVEEKVFETDAHSGNQAVSHILSRVFDSEGIGITMNYLKDYKGDPSGNLSHYTVNMQDLRSLEERVAVSKIEGSLMEVDELPDVTNLELATAVSKKLGGDPREYMSFIRSYFN